MRNLLTSPWLRAALLALLVGAFGLIPLLRRSVPVPAEGSTAAGKTAPDPDRDKGAPESSLERCPRGTLEDGGACVPVPH